MNYLTLSVLGFQQHIQLAELADPDEDEYKDEDKQKINLESKEDIYYIISCETTLGNKIYIKIYTEYHMCSSGYTTAETCHLICWEDNNIDIPLTHIAKEKIIINLNPLAHEISNNAFLYSKYGEDSYYPEGHFVIHYENFTQLDSFKYQRQVWVFTGDKNTGKKFLANQTDSFLLYGPDDIIDGMYNSTTDTETSILTEDIIIVPKKTNFRRLKHRLKGNPEMIIVNFSKTSK